MGPICGEWRVLPFSCPGQIPVALLNSEGAGSVRTLVCLPGAHLYLQVFGKLSTSSVAVVPSLLTIAFVSHKHHRDRDMRAAKY